MKIELVDNDSFNIFINSNFLKELDFDDKDKIIDVVREVIKKYKSTLNMKGFYKVKVFVCEKVGLFLNIIKIEDIDFSNNIDLRVIVSLGERIFFETDSYEIIPKGVSVRFLNNKFYVDVSSIKNIYKLLEFGRFVYGDEVSKIVTNSHIL